MGAAALETMRRLPDSSIPLEPCRTHALTSSLIRGHFSAKALICTLMLQGLEDIRQSGNSAEKSSSGPW
jgi:hypothetical protein